MCGIFGVVTKPEKFPKQVTQQIMDRLFILSESRGKEASGVAVKGGDDLLVAKYALPATTMIRQSQHQDVVRASLDDDESLCVIGHSRLVTNGSAHIHTNNQPVIADGIVAIHNGIITNVDALWRRYAGEFQPTSQLDTEVLLRLTHKYLQANESLVGALRCAYAELEGVASVAMLFETLDILVLATNNGSLYTLHSADGDALIFASERYILERIAEEYELSNGDIEHVDAGQGYIIDLKSLTRTKFSLAMDDTLLQPMSLPTANRQIKDISRLQSTDAPEIRGEGPYILAHDFVDEYPKAKVAVDALRRCTRCVLPETMPFIEFDSEGVCNYCRQYEPIQLRGLDALQAELEQYRKTDGSPDFLIPFSGGRDSSYVVHLVTKELGFRPLTYTYDWGMVTDLARRNQMRLCGKLGLEHILISADIERKRSNIRANVLAWLNQPDLGMVPLFMAGDKQYFYYANKVAEQNNLNLNLLGENLLETTRFKTGYANIKPNFGSGKTYSLSLLQKLQLAFYYGARYLRNPGYINQSLADTINAFGSYYVMSHNINVNVFDYITWDEDTIIGTLLGEYNWETAPDTTSTWRIGDGTAAFYNYIYYIMGGVTENDTFRSNQVREGQLTRAEALALVEKENEPRYESMQWYCDIINIDFYDAVKRINQAPRSYNSDSSSAGTAR